MRSLDEITQRHKNLKQSRRRLAREAQETLIREETLNWVMGNPAADGALDTPQVDEEEATESVEEGETE
jgi:hypothetical protein